MKAIAGAAILVLALSCSGKGEKKFHASGTEVEQSKDVSKLFGKKYDLSRFFETEKDYGTDGVFDTMNQRILFHFGSIKQSPTNKLVYHVRGEDLLDSLMMPLEGEITISKMEEVEHPFSKNSKDKLVNFYADYELREDKSGEGSGVFTGELHFSLSKTGKNKLKNDLMKRAGPNCANFVYDGVWTNYETGQTMKCIWGQGKLPDTGDFYVGNAEMVVNEKYLKNGWERDANNKLLVNPKNWWLRK